MEGGGGGGGTVLTPPSSPTSAHCRPTNFIFGSSRLFLDFLLLLPLLFFIFVLIFLDFISESYLTGSIECKRKKKTKETNRFDFRSFRGNSFFYFGNFKIALFLLFSSSSFFKSLRAKIVQVGFFFLYEMRGENLHVFPEECPCSIGESALAQRIYACITKMQLTCSVNRSDEFRGTNMECWEERRERDSQGQVEKGF